MLAKLLPFPKDKAMQSRFSGAIARWMGKREIINIPAEKKVVYLNGFQFNAKYWLSQRLKVDLSVTRVSDNMLQLNIPAFVPIDSIIAPEGTVSVTLQVCVAPIDLATCMSLREFYTNIEIAYTAVSMDPQTIALPVNTQGGALIITACALKYMVNEQEKTVLSRDPAYMPAGIVDARYC
jgi:hypothetical protein